MASPPSPGAVYVDRIDLRVERALFGLLTRVRAEVRIVGPDGQPVAGALVLGAWDGTASGLGTGTTDARGVAALRSPWMWRHGVLGFAVQDVIAVGYGSVDGGTRHLISW
jgi:hypothetical protein